MSEADEKNSRDQANPGADKLNHPECVSHLKAGYDNSQAVVRFLDTKASAVIGVIPIVIGILTALVGMIKEWGAWQSGLHAEGACLLVACLVITGLCAISLIATAVLAISAGFCAISPRDTGTTKPSVVFPFEKSYVDSPPDHSYAARVTHFVEGANNHDLLEDYKRQLVRMSRIVQQKIDQR